MAKIYDPGDISEDRGLYCVRVPYSEQYAETSRISGERYTSTAMYLALSTYLFSFVKRKVTIWHFLNKKISLFPNSVLRILTLAARFFVHVLVHIRKHEGSKGVERTFLL